MNLKVYPLGEKGNNIDKKKRQFSGVPNTSFFGGLYLDRNDLGGTINRNVRIFTVLCMRCQAVPTSFFLVDGMLPRCSFLKCKYDSRHNCGM